MSVILTGHLILLIQVGAFAQVTGVHPGNPPADWPAGSGPPPRARYVKRMDEVILGFDHFCWWLGTPIGFRNRKFFILFVLWSAILAGFGLVLAAAEGCRMLPGVCTGQLVDPSQLTSNLAKSLPADIIAATAHEPALAHLHSSVFAWALAFAELDSSETLYVSLALGPLLLIDFAACLLLSLFGGWHVYLALKGRATVGHRVEDFVCHAAPNGNGRHTDADLPCHVCGLIEDERNFDMGALDNWRQIFGDQWWLWALPVAGDAPQGDGIHWPRRSDRGGSSKRE